MSSLWHLPHNSSPKIRLRIFFVYNIITDAARFASPSQLRLRRSSQDSTHGRSPSRLARSITKSVCTKKGGKDSSMLPWTLCPPSPIVRACMVTLKEEANAMAVVVTRRRQCIVDVNPFRVLCLQCCWFVAVGNQPPILSLHHTGHSVMTYVRREPVALGPVASQVGPSHS